MHVNWELVGEIVFARQEVGPLICVKCDSIGKKKKEKVTRP
jgi:hypothetical protein